MKSALNYMGKMRSFAILVFTVSGRFPVWPAFSVHPVPAPVDSLWNYQCNHLQLWRS